MEKYIAVEWPEAQKFQGEDFTEVGYDPMMEVWFVPEEMYNKVMKKDEKKNK